MTVMYRKQYCMELKHGCLKESEMGILQRTKRSIMFYLFNFFMFSGSINQTTQSMILNVLYRKEASLSVQTE